METLKDALREFSSGRFSEAEQICRKLIKSFPDNRNAVELLVVTLTNLSRFEEATALVRELISRAPAAVQFKVYLGILLLHQERLHDAHQCLSEAKRIAPSDPACLFNLGLVLFKLERYSEAADALKAARRNAPGLQVAAIYEARALIELSFIEEAQTVIKSLANVRGLKAEEINEYARACISLALFPEAEVALVQAAAETPSNVAIKVNLAHVFERTNRSEAAAALLDDLEAPGPFGRALKARVIARTGRTDEALALLSQLREELRPFKSGTEDLCAQIEFDRGRMLDQTGRYAEAYKAFQLGNSIDRQTFERICPGCEIEGGLPWLAESQDLITLSSEGYSRQETMDADPVFLVGFPRSGTTLLDQILNAHPQIDVLEEKPLVESLIRIIGTMPLGYPRAIASLREKDIAGLRFHYWQTVAKFIDRNPNNAFVDKNPFNLCQAQLLRRLFPQAKWIFAMRHPLDSILSCFVNRFRYTKYSHGFWNLEEISRIYRDTVGLWLAQRPELTLQCHDIYYEKLVAEPEAQARALIDFLGLPWDSEVLQYYRHARDRIIGTPSYDQVVKPIYGDAIARWRHYEGELSAAKDIVRPVAQALGYAC